MILMIFAVSIIALGFLAIAGSAYASRTSRLDRAERNELRALRTLMARIDQLAYTHRDLDSALSVQIIDEMNKTRRHLR